MSKNSVNKDWEILFDKYNIVEKVKRNGLFHISAKQIQIYHEPRLMVKHDHSVNRPEIFKHYGLSILPVTRGDYVIGEMNLYQSFLVEGKLLFSDENVIPVSQPNIESIDFGNISSEAIAINSMYASGILGDFLGEDHLIPTVNGRMGTGCFSFQINKSDRCTPFDICIDNSQMEIDGGYEGDECLCLIEAKNSLSDDFLIRQLYYPYRVWERKVTKKVRPVFLCYSSGIYHLMEYEFEELNNYNSLILKKYARYQIQENTFISLVDLIDLMRKTPVRPEPHVPFPQANSLLRVVDLCEQLAHNESAYEDNSLSKSDIADIYGFDPRQSDYYANAGIYLGLIVKIRSATYGLSCDGKQIFCTNLSPFQRNLKIAEKIFEHKVFRDCFYEYITKTEPLSNEEYMTIMRNNSLYQMTENLIPRRSSTVSNWINWLLNLQTD